MKSARLLAARSEEVHDKLKHKDKELGYLQKQVRHLTSQLKAHGGHGGKT